MTKQGGSNRNASQKDKAEAWAALSTHKHPASFARTVTGIHNQHAQMKTLDVTKVLPEYSISRMIRAYSRLSHALDTAIRKRRTDKITKLVLMMQDIKAKIEKDQARIDTNGAYAKAIEAKDFETSLMISKRMNLTNDPKSVRQPNVRSIVGNVVRTGHSRKVKTPSTHTVNLGDKAEPVNVKITRGKPVPVTGTFTEKQRLYAEYRKRLEQERK